MLQIYKELAIMGDLFELLPVRVTQALNILDVLQLKKNHKSPPYLRIDSL